MFWLAVTYAAAYGGAVVGVVRPYWGLLIYIWLSIVRPQHVWMGTVPTANYSRWVGIAILVGWVLHGLGDWNLRKAWPIVLTLVAGFLWLVVSALHAAVWDLAYIAVDSHLKIVLPCLVGITLVRTPGQVRALIWTMIIGEAVVALRVNDLYFTKGPAIAYYFTDSYGGLGRAGNSSHLGAGLALAIMCGLTSRTWRERFLTGGISGLLANAIMISGSRGGMLASLIGVGLGFLLIEKKRWHYLAALGVLLAGGVLAGKSVKERFSTTFQSKEKRDASAQSRFVLWQQGWQTACQHPVFGVGPEHWPFEAKKYGWEDGREVHSMWISTAAELGFPGLGLLVLLYGSAVYLLFKQMRKKPGNDPYGEMDKTALVAILAYAAAVSFITPKYIEIPYYVMLAGAAILKLRVRDGGQPAEAAEEGAGLQAAAEPWRQPAAVRAYS